MRERIEEKRRPKNVPEGGSTVTGERPATQSGGLEGNKIVAQGAFDAIVRETPQVMVMEFVVCTLWQKT
jgi:hypothetical protein